MKLQDIAFADGQVESVRTSSAVAEIVFADWRNAKWKLTFVEVLAVENANIEGDELDRLEVRSDDPYIQRIRLLVDEPDASVNMYLLFTPWKEEPRLRVVASDCRVELVDEPLRPGAPVE